MTYENVPEHAGFEGVSLGDGEETAASVEDRRPLVVTSTDEWLARISDQLQSFADLIDEVRAESEDDESSEVVGSPDSGSDEGGAETKGDDKSAGSPDPAAPPADATPAAAKKAAATPAKKTTEVKGD